MLSVLPQADLRKFKASLSCIVSFRTARLPGENLSQKKKMVSENFEDGTQGLAFLR